MTLENTKIQSSKTLSTKTQSTRGARRGLTLALVPALCCASLLLAGAAQAQPRSGGGSEYEPGLSARSGSERAGRVAGRSARHRGERHATRLANALDLTAEQTAAWDELRAAHEEAVQPLREDLRAHHQALRTLLEDTAADPTTVGTEVLAGRELRTQLEEAHALLDASFRDLLTAEQLERYDTIQEMGPRFRGRRGAGGRRGPAPRSFGDDVG